MLKSKMPARVTYSIGILNQTRSEDVTLSQWKGHFAFEVEARSRAITKTIEVWVAKNPECVGSPYFGGVWVNNEPRLRCRFLAAQNRDRSEQLSNTATRRDQQYAHNANPRS